MKPVYTETHERYELRVAKSDRTCWTWQERDGASEDQCRRIIGSGETYMVSTIYPGHDSGYADGGWRQKLRWTGKEYVWEREEIAPSPIANAFCLPCCERWNNLQRALAWIESERGAA